jgi:aerobic carbon-monoxide dehydrogenase medium subunit
MYEFEFERPTSIAEADAALSQEFAPEAIKGLALPGEGRIGDLHGTPEYRAHLVGVMTARGVAAATR